MPAEARPEAVAVELGDRRLTYRELWGRARRLAGRLRDRGVGRDAVVGVLMERSLEMVVAVLGVMEAGAAYLPLEPELPDDRLRFMVSDARARVVLALPAHAERLRGAGARVAGRGAADPGRRLAPARSLAAGVNKRDAA